MQHNCSSDLRDPSEVLSRHPLERGEEHPAGGPADYRPTWFDSDVQPVCKSGDAAHRAAVGPGRRGTGKALPDFRPVHEVATVPLRGPLLRHGSGDPGTWSGRRPGARSPGCGNGGGTGIADPTPAAFNRRAQGGQDCPPAGAAPGTAFAGEKSAGSPPMDGSAMTPRATATCPARGSRARVSSPAWLATASGARMRATRKRMANFRSSFIGSSADGMKPYVPVIRRAGLPCGVDGLG